jgi:hypothetical protein
LHGFKNGIPRCFNGQVGWRVFGRGITPEKLFHELWGFGRPWRLTRCEYGPKDGTARGELEGMVRLWVGETEGLWSGVSVAAGQALSCYEHVGEELVWRHLDVFEHR